MGHDGIKIEAKLQRENKTEINKSFPIENLFRNERDGKWVAPMTCSALNTHACKVRRCPF